MTEQMGRYKVLAVRKPGQKGTKRLAAKYGSRLRCVRYLYDRVTGLHCKSVDLLEPISTWEPCDLNPEELVAVRLGMQELEIREKVKKRGGRWDPYDKVWILRYQDLEALGLQRREISIREEEGLYEV